MLAASPVIAVIGGGPAGMSCALWLRNYALRPIIIEKESMLGGMADRSPYPNEGLLGRPNESARDNASAFAEHIRQVSIETWLNARVQQIRRDPEAGFQLQLARPGMEAGLAVSAAALVIATGTRFEGAEWLERVENARAMATEGRLHAGAPWAAEPYVQPGMHVAVIGGGDNAFDVARMLARRGVHVTIVMRSKQPKALPLLVHRLRQFQASGMVQVLSERTVRALHYSHAGIRATLSGGEHIEVDHVLLLLGYRPNTDEPWMTELAVERDARGYIVVDVNTKTSSQGVFAIGDVADPRHPCIATALGSGTKAAREIANRIYRRSDRLR